MMPRMSPARRLSMMELGRRPAFLTRMRNIFLIDAMRPGTTSNAEAHAIAQNRVSEMVATAREFEKEIADVN